MINCTLITLLLSNLRLMSILFTVVKAFLAVYPGRIENNNRCALKKYFLFSSFSEQRPTLHRIVEFVIFARSTQSTYLSSHSLCLTLCSFPLLFYSCCCCVCCLFLRRSVISFLRMYHAYSPSQLNAYFSDNNATYPHIPHTHKDIAVSFQTKAMRAQKRKNGTFAELFSH